MSQPRPLSKSKDNNRQMFFRAPLHMLRVLQIKKGYKAASAGAKDLEASNCLETTAKNYADKVHPKKKKGGTCARKKNDITLLGHPHTPSLRLAESDHF